MLRRIIKIDKEKCVGCGLCVDACHEGAIALIDGKAELIKDDYCDGLGDCLPTCPTNAISFETREAAEYDELAVKAKKASSCNCPSSKMKTFSPKESVRVSNEIVESQLRQWPVQIKLVPINAPYFENANLLICADCVAFAYGNLHNDFMKGKITLIGCPKLDNVDYSEKLTEIIKNNNIKSVTVVKMEVPCCGGLEVATVKALKASGKFLQWRVVTISTDGQILD